MALTPAQKKATDAFKKKLEQSKEHIASGGDPGSWSNGGSSGGSSSGGKTYPHDFVGPIRHGDTYSPAPTPQPGDSNFVGPI